MNVYINRKPIFAKEFIINTFLYSHLVSLFVFLKPLFPLASQKEMLLFSDMWGEYYLVVEASITTLMYFWFRCSENMQLGFMGVWTKKAKGTLKFGITGFVLGLFVPFLSSLALGVVLASIAVTTIFPFRWQKTLDTYNMNKWTNEEVIVAKSQLVNDKNKILKNAVNKEFESRNLTEE